MAGWVSDYLKGKLLDHALGNTAYTAPSTVYLALYTVAPTSAGGGTEVTGGSYARIAVTNNTTNFPDASGTSTKTKGLHVQQDFSPLPSAIWGTVVAMTLMDASSGGNQLIGTNEVTPTPIGTNDPVSVLADTFLLFLT